jgi:hypothetical protein
MKSHASLLCIVLLLIGALVGIALVSTLPGATYRSPSIAISDAAFHKEALERAGVRPDSLVAMGNAWPGQYHAKSADADGRPLIVLLHAGMIEVREVSY